AAVQLAPPFTEVRYWYPDTPEFASVEPLAETSSETTFCHESEPPLSVGAVGAVRSRRTVVAGVGEAGAQLDVYPAASVARNWTTVSPCAEIVAVEPDCTAPQVVPPSVEVRYW